MSLYKNASTADLEAEARRVREMRAMLANVAFDVSFQREFAVAQFAIVRRQLKQTEAAIDAELAIRERMFSLAAV